MVVFIVSSFAFKEPHNLMATPPRPKPRNYGVPPPQAPIPRSGFVLVPSPVVPAGRSWRPENVRFRA